MALQIQLSTDFQTSAVNFSKLRKNKNGGKAIYLSNNGNQFLMQLPFMRAPFGLSSYTDPATNKVTSHSLDLSFDKSEPGVEELESKFKELDELIINTVAENSQEWLGKNFNKAVLKEALYKPIVKPSKGDYASTIKLKILTDARTGEFIPESYNSRREAVTLDSIEKGQKVMSIVDFNQIWFIDNKFGVTVRLKQCLLEPSKKLPAFAFQGVNVEDEVTSEMEDGEVDY
jgi:hypothetical protein